MAWVLDSQPPGRRRIRPATRSCCPWARQLGAIEAFGIEGTGSYGVGLASFVRRQGLHVVEVNYCDRRKRRNNGKDDTLDAETAARSVLAGIATATPKTADGAAEMVRQIKIARDAAVKARSAAIITLKTLIVNAPDALSENARAARRPATPRPLHRFQTGRHHQPDHIQWWRMLSAEIATHDEVLDTITWTAAPTLHEGFRDWHRLGGRDVDRRG